MSPRAIGPRIRPDGVPLQVGRGYDQYTLRLPDGLRDRIKAAAAANGRSMNTEIIASLQAAMDGEEARGMAALEARLRAIVERLEARNADADT